MTGFVPNLVIPLTVGSIVALIVLSVLLVIARVRRDRREAVQARRRVEIVRAIDFRDAAALTAITSEAVTRQAVRTDLVDVMRRMDAGVVGPYAPRALVECAIADTGRPLAVSRALGAELVAQIGRPEDLVHTARVLHADPDRQARRVAARALSRRGDDAAARHLVDALAVSSLSADRLVEQLGHPFALPQLLEALDRPGMAHALGDVIAALGLAGDPRALPAVARFVRDGGRHERLRACRALGRLRRDEAVLLLIYAMGDESHTVRAMAARSLGELGDPRCVRVLELSLRDQNWWVRANAGDALRGMGAEGIAALRRALDGDDRFAREHAAESLAMHEAGRDAHDDEHAARVPVAA